MGFSSNVFLFLFLPLFLATYYLTPNRGRLRNWVVLLGSYIFYAWWRVDFLLLFAAVTVFNYLVGRKIGEHGRGQPRALHWLRLGVVVDLAVLGYFKYANFGVASFNEAMAGFGFAPFQMAHVLLPIGISFYLFESISYIMDVHRGDAEPARHPVDFATFVSLFPHLIVGPIFRYKDLANQFDGRTHTVEKFAEGCTRFMQGFVKKVFIADTLAPLANHCFALAHPSTAESWLGALSYAAQLYFDFSGYSDMAIGLGLMMGFRFIENFNHPLLSQSNTEFWRRWHISLSTWLRDYVYYALGGNRFGPVRTYFNVFMTFLLGGMWHGANWTYFAWGTLQGSLICIERVAGVSGRSTTFRLHRWLPAFLCVMISMVIFRADTVGSAFRMYDAMFIHVDAGGLGPSILARISHLQIATLALAYALVLLEGLREFGPKLQLGSATFRERSAIFLLVPMFLVSVLKLSAQGYTAFLYFQF